MYSSFALWGIGLALLTDNWIFVVIAVLMCAVFILRVPKEEQMMIDEFGGEYREYMKRTGRAFSKF